MGFEASRERRFVSNQARKSGVFLWERDKFLSNLKPKPLSDTFFILGAGSSINNLSLGNFNEIASHYSVGVNTWPVHSFVPDFYSFECVSWIGDGFDLSRALQSLGRKDILEAKPPILLLRLKTDSEISQLQALPKGFQGPLFFYGRVSPSTRKESNLEGDLTWFHKTQNNSTPQIVVDSGASIVRMISLGIFLGYRRIVLTGVDLNNSPYFWQENDFYAPQLRQFPVYSRQTGPSHETLDTARRPFTSTDMIRELAHVVTNSFDGTIYVSSQESSLASILPIYPWSDL